MQCRRYVRCERLKIEGKRVHITKRLNRLDKVIFEVSVISACG